MKWWGYLITLIVISLPFYIYARRQDIKGAIGFLITRRAVRSQKYYIQNFVFKSGGNSVHFDYLVINSSGVFAVTLHNLKGRLIHFQGRIYLKAFLGGRRAYKYLNPVPHDVKKVIQLNAFVPENADIIPVVVFPRGNDNKLRAMWITPVKELQNVFSEPCDEPLTEDEVEKLYESLLKINIKDKKAKKRQNVFMKRHCPDCGSFIYDAQDGSKICLKCSACSFRVDLTASIIPPKDDD